MSLSLEVNSWFFSISQLQLPTWVGSNQLWVAPDRLDRSLTVAHIFWAKNMSAHWQARTPIKLISHWNVHPMRRECLPRFSPGHRKP